MIHQLPADYQSGWFWCTWKKEVIIELQPQPAMSGFQRRTACCGSIVSLLVLLLAQHAYSRDPCDPLVPEYCALPFPNSYFTTVDKSTLTGIRVNFSVDTFPLDIIGRPVDPKEWNEMGTTWCYEIYCFATACRDHCVGVEIGWGWVIISPLILYCGIRTHMHMQMVSLPFLPSYPTFLNCQITIFPLTGM